VGVAARLPLDGARRAAGKVTDLEIGGYGSDDRDRFRLPDIVARRYRNKYGAELVPERSVVVGDSPNDIACARSAGFWAVVVGHRPDLEELSSRGPDAVLDRLEPDLVWATIALLVRDS
jgi:phosphoglycolate phosphatase